ALVNSRGLMADAQRVAVAGASHTSTFGGTWFDSQTGRLKIGVVDASPAVESPLLAAVVNKSSADFVVVLRTQAALTAMREHLWNDRPALASQGVHLNAVGEKTDLNAVLVEIDPTDRSDAAGLLGALYGAGLVVTRGIPSA